MLVSVYLYYAPTVPTFNSLDDYQPKLGTRIYSADNQLIGEFAAERRVPRAVRSIPPLLVKSLHRRRGQALLQPLRASTTSASLQAVVDKLLQPRRKAARRLHHHAAGGQEPARHARELRRRPPSAQLSRKIREAILARRLEASLSKEDILYLYVSQIFLGHKAYGVQAAAEHYFRKNVWELTLAEMATLAGLPQRPSDYSPVSRPEAAKARRRYVLRRMPEDGYITKAEAEAACNEELTVYPREELYLKIAPYYTEQVRRELIDRYGERACSRTGSRSTPRSTSKRRPTLRAAISRACTSSTSARAFAARSPSCHDGAARASSWRPTASSSASTPASELTLEAGKTSTWPSSTSVSRRRPHGHARHRRRTRPPAARRHALGAQAQPHRAHGRCALARQTQAQRARSRATSSPVTPTTRDKI